MDTKWKNSKKIISFLVFFLGVSLALGSLAGILGKKPASAHIWELDRLLEDDYQENARFRDYVAGRLEDFLIMATGEEGLWGIWGYEDGTYYGSGCGGRYDGGYGYGYGYTRLLAEAAREAFPLQEDIPQEAACAEEDSGNASFITPGELSGYLESLKEMQEAYLKQLDEMEDAEDSASRETIRSEMEMYQEEMRNLVETIQDYLPGRLSEEGRRKRDGKTV